MATVATVLILPIPPSDNHSHDLITRPSRHPDKLQLLRVPSSRTKAYYQEAGWLAKTWMLETGWQVPPPDQKLVLRYWVFWPDARRRDPGNLPKVLLDSLKGVLFSDDNICMPQAMDFTVDRQHPRIEITLRRARPKRSPSNA